MKPRKTALSLLCAVALTLTLLVVPSSASGSLFFLSLNDTLPAQSTQTTPIQYNGWVYVPVNVFSSRITGINFGVYYGVTENGSSILLYNLSGRSITFDLTNGTAVTSEGETINPSRAIAQDGVYYVPAYPICRYFGLTYSYYSTDYGPLLRIKDGNAVLSDALFLNSAESIMRSRANSYAQDNTPNGGDNGGGSEDVTLPGGGGTTTPPTTDGNTPVAPEIPEDAAVNGAEWQLETVDGHFCHVRYSAAVSATGTALPKTLMVSFYDSEATYRETWKEAMQNREANRIDQLVLMGQAKQGN